MLFDIPCIIFAGGKSSRMGEDKALLPFGSFDTLVEFQLHNLKKIFKNIYISCKEKSKFNFEATFIEDIKTSSTYAPTLGFVSAYEYLESDKFFVISVDTPFITLFVIKELLSADKDTNDATIAKLNGSIQPMCGIYHRSLEKKFSQMLQDDNHKLGLLLKNSNTDYVEFKEEKPFLNLNHPHEYQEALNILNS
ncbi:MAG: molybdenum cofactor guanylyltransferase MobA [Sulfurimonas sp.]|jgi:molybdopterin-guanine dinucleotide biosynthesis protein A|uniref:molybdenum cofactor guanylyltransferase MobA n=1 Tax=Sulfurimonas sp. TaxID=2022749 RepID=UPI00262FF8CC|nr:molybdenum cofactor guanylyltransferase MobA [Sulfurimonas sp.]MDD3476101.1 molybdenum cofactor guanylyltransferase MobA [Sulfurimonas sp.]